MVTVPDPAGLAQRTLSSESSSCLAAPPRYLAAATDAPEGLLLALDTLEHCFAFLDRRGEVQHSSRAFQEILMEPLWHGLGEEVRRFAASLWGTANVRGLAAVIERMPPRAVRLGSGECRLQGAFVGVDLFGAGASVLIGMQVPHRPSISVERLRKRYGLTRKQSRVALLLAEGLRNDEIAQRLFISVHTARHHVEQVRVKVGGHTRGAVASRILQSEG